MADVSDALDMNLTPLLRGFFCIRYSSPDKYCIEVVLRR